MDECVATRASQPPELQQFGHIRIDNGPINISISYGDSPDFTEKAFEKAVESGRDFIRTLHEQHMRETQRVQAETDTPSRYDNIGVGHMDVHLYGGGGGGGRG